MTMENAKERLVTSGVGGNNHGFFRRTWINTMKSLELERKEFGTNNNNNSNNGQATSSASLVTSSSAIAAGASVGTTDSSSSKSIAGTVLGTTTVAPRTMTKRRRRNRRVKSRRKKKTTAALVARACVHLCHHRKIHLQQQPLITTDCVECKRLVERNLMCCPCCYAAENVTRFLFHHSSTRRNINDDDDDIRNSGNNNNDNSRFVPMSNYGFLKEDNDDLTETTTVRNGNMFSSDRTKRTIKSYVR